MTAFRGSTPNRPARQPGVVGFRPTSVPSLPGLEVDGEATRAALARAGPAADHRGFVSSPGRTLEGGRLGPGRSLLPGAADELLGRGCWGGTTCSIVSSPVTCTLSPRRRRQPKNG